MARASRSRLRQRDALLSIANPLDELLAAIEPVARRVPLVSLLDQAPAYSPETDRRLYSPTPRSFRSVVTSTGHAAGVRAGSRLERLSALFFSAPGGRDNSRVLECVRRKARAEVLHALRLTGRGGAGGGRRRRTWRSGIGC